MNKSVNREITFVFMHNKKNYIEICSAEFVLFFWDQRLHGLISYCFKESQNQQLLRCVGMTKMYKHMHTQIKSLLISKSYFRSSQCSTTGVCVILSVGWCI